MIENAPGLPLYRTFGAFSTPHMHRRVRAFFFDGGGAGNDISAAPCAAAGPQAARGNTVHG